MRILGGVVLALLLATAVVPAEAASGPFRFTRIQYDAPGDDTANLNGEYVTIKNISSTKRSLAGYRVKDKANHVYDFGKPALNPGQSLRLYTGSGTYSNGVLIKRYQGADAPIWNNAGDKAYLTKDGTVRDSCAWGDGPGYVNC